MKSIIYIIIFSSLIFARENPFEEVYTKKINIDKKVDIKEEKNIVKIYKWFLIIEDKNSIFLKTKDKILKSFTIDNPKKIVIDFKSKRGFKTKRVKLKYNRYIKEIAIGSHKRYYRLALAFKKYSSYKILEKKDGYLLSFR